VTASGAVLPFAEGHARIAGATGVVPVDIDLKAACITLAPGESLRLSLAGAAFPPLPSIRARAKAPTPQPFQRA
jgi:predicted acyl esterase